MYTWDIGRICGGSTVYAHVAVFDDTSCIQPMYVVYSGK